MNYTNSPYVDIPNELMTGYTMNNTIPILKWWMDGSKKSGVKWSKEYIQTFVESFTVSKIKSNQEGNSPYGNHVCRMLLDSFEKYDINNKKVAVVGSETPWVEAILLNLGNHVTTIEYNVPDADYDNLICRDYFTYFEHNENTFDCIVTFSSIEHSGLGRYGDPLDPNGDIKTMQVINKNLKKDGLLIWGAPVGADVLVWNVHRIYGKLRLPIMFENFTELEWFGWDKNHLFTTRSGHSFEQPVVVLQKNNC